MVRLVRRCAAMLALVILSSGPATGLALAQGERPDLKIEVVGLDPSNPRAVKVRVTNVGQWWADRTTATVEAVPAAAGAKVTEQVADLDPKQQPQGPTDYRYEFTYTLATPCGGQKVEVKASLSTAKTFNGNSEANTANNSHAREVCAAAQAPSKPFDPAVVGVKTRFPGGDKLLQEDEGTIDYGACPGCAIPEHLRPGVHGDGGPWPPLVIESSAATSATRGSETGAICAFRAPRPPLLVGWFQDEDNCSFVQVAQTAVAFDLAKLDEAPRKFVLSARLAYDEAIVSSTYGGGDPKPAAGCVFGLGILKTNIGAQPGEALYPLDAYNEVYNLPPPAGPVKEWDVTGHVQQQAMHPDDPSLRHGFVLRGSDEAPRGDDNASCLSSVSNIRLRVTYTVPSN